MSFLKPILIAVIIILALLIIVKANRFATSDQPSNERPKDPVKPEKCGPPRTGHPLSLYHRQP